MKLNELIETVLDKDNFLSISDYISFSSKYLEFIKSNLQAVIVSKNENNYRFFQYKEDGTFNVTRPINSDIMLSLEDFKVIKKDFLYILKELKKTQKSLSVKNDVVNNFVYTSQQCIGATLDALPAKKSNFARKINGDLFERFILLILEEIGLDISSGNLEIPIIIDKELITKMKYQHDLVLKNNNKIKAIGSVKTSSKDRMDKIFLDKFLYNKLTGENTPHFAIFLNDVQRKGKEGKYGINATFLPGHFKVYTIKLNPLDGVYYFDIRPNMQKDKLLKSHINKFDKFLLNDVWKYCK